MDFQEFIDKSVSLEATYKVTQEVLMHFKNVVRI